MENHKIFKLLYDSIVLFIKVNSLSNEQYSVNKNIRKTPMLRSELCYYIDVYIAVKGTINVESTNANN